MIKFENILPGGLILAGSLLLSCKNNHDSTVLSPAVGTAVLALNSSLLDLSVTGHDADGTASGLARNLIVTNTSSDAAINLQISDSGLPSGTSFSSTCAATLAPSASCTITVTPGATASSDVDSASCASGTEPVAGTIDIEADNANSLEAEIRVLDYGCLYRGGNIFAFIEDSDANQSVGGKVLAVSTQSLGVIWSSNGSGAISLDAIPGVDETSTSAVQSPTYSTFDSNFSTSYTTTPDLTPSSSFLNCNGAVAGACNSENILNFYNAYVTNYNGGGTPPFTPSSGPTDLSEYAAGVCSTTIATYSDWYLPAICEMGSDDTVPDSGCGTVASPTVQNIQSSLVSPGIVALTGLYFSSTELSTNNNYAWKYSFSSSGGTISSNRKGIAAAVRCVRDFGHCLGRSSDGRVCLNFQH